MEGGKSVAERNILFDVLKITSRMEFDFSKINWSSIIPNFIHRLVVPEDSLAN